MVDQEKVVSLYEDGKTQAEVAEIVGVTQGYVSMILSEHEVATPFTKWWEVDEVAFLEKHYPPETEEEKQRIIRELCVEGRTWKGVRDKADALGLTRSNEEFMGSRANRNVLDRIRNRVEIDTADPQVGYVVGVLDTDGYTDNVGQIGLEAKDNEFVAKFCETLSALGFNPSVNASHRGPEKQLLYACSKEFVEWYQNELDRFEMTDPQKRLYLEGMHEGDGTIHQTGYCMICSQDREFKEFIADFLENEFGFTSRIWQDGVALVPRAQRERFLSLIDPVVKGPEYYEDDRRQLGIALLSVWQFLEKRGHPSPSDRGRTTFANVTTSPKNQPSGNAIPSHIAA